MADLRGLPQELLVTICKVSPLVGRNLHVAWKDLNGRSTPEERLAWYYLKDRKGRTWIRMDDQCLLHNYADPSDPYLTIIKPATPLIWYKFGNIHRDGDQPAVIADVSPVWYEDGEAWYMDSGRLWYQNGQLHRDGDKPAHVSLKGSRTWYQNDQLHRDGDQPASIYGHMQEWYQFDKLHRDGNQPAVIDGHGHCYYWYRNGECYQEYEP